MGGVLGGLLFVDHPWVFAKEKLAKFSLIRKATFLTEVL